MDFGIIKTGGKQYKVKEGETLKVEKIRQLADAPKDGKLLFDDILAGKKVTAKIISEGRHDKVRILKFHRRKRYKKVTGHRQAYSEIKIEKIK